ncbi:MAG: metallophosphoesterase [Rhodobiaceae bacterium]|nr:metallophosphoesterase [Rhodobiaceae bacterium]MCC0055003.1 metallophosphoesterase [Rhodobiaceae bacterium]
MAQQNDIDKMLPMVRWFDISVLFKIIKPVIISAIFGKYADRRLVHAALDRPDENEMSARADIRANFVPDEDGAVWFDYAADTGDGFSSTYSIALSLAAPTLSIDGKTTRRGDLLVLGGDQVYPDASLENYINRFQTPFMWALPDQGSEEGVPHPYIFAVPGNHDWYDGLTLFLALFCKKTEWKIGNWRAPQRRSYFALRLTDDWWLWGVDVALEEDVDQPQSDYFEEILGQMPSGANLIICTAEPGWQYASVRGEQTFNHKAYESLGYFSGLVRKSGKDIKIPLVLSGDTHHYCRYVAEKSGTQFITAGGGGAFLHPTHQLQDEVRAWWFRSNDRLTLAPNTSRQSADVGGDAKARYPSESASKKLLWGNLGFAFGNWKLSGLLGFDYAFFGLLSLMWSDLGTWANLFSNPLWWIAVLVNGAAFWGYADERNWVRHGKVVFRNSAPWMRKAILASSHVLAHVVALTALARLLYTYGTERLGLEFWTWGFNSYFVASMLLIGGIVAGTIFGSYLLFSCRLLAAHPNDAFSALSLDGYKNFLRFRISGNSITVFPIGLDTVPKRNLWKPNPAHETDASQPEVIADGGLTYRLIEEPIVISS